VIADRTGYEVGWNSREQHDYLLISYKITQHYDIVHRDSKSYWITDAPRRKNDHTQCTTLYLENYTVYAVLFLHISVTSPFLCGGVPQSGVNLCDHGTWTLNVTDQRHVTDRETDRQYGGITELCVASCGKKPRLRRFKSNRDRHTFNMAAMTSVSSYFSAGCPPDWKGQYTPR